MKTFTATQLNKKPQEVFSAAKKEGSAFIDHDRHSNGFFSIVWHSTEIPTAEPQPHPASDQQ